MTPIISEIDTKIWPYIVPYDVMITPWAYVKIIPKSCLKFIIFEPLFLESL